MTEEQIKKNAENIVQELSVSDKVVMYSRGNMITAAIAGAHSRDEEIEELQNELESLRKGFYERGDKLKELMLANNKLRNPWISVEERLPKKVDGRICSNAVLVSIYGDDWTVAEYHFGDKQWINLFDEIKIEPKYWQEVNLPEEVLEKEK